jgi:hypothetical protein
MGLTSLPDGITSDGTTHTARPAADIKYLWEASWLPGRRVTRDDAVTAMPLADLVGPDTNSGHRLWARMEAGVRELGVSAPEALDRLAVPPRWAAAPKHAVLDDPEAAG